MLLIRAVTPNKIRLIVKIRALIVNPLKYQLKPVTATGARKLYRNDFEKNSHTLCFRKQLLDGRSKRTISYRLTGHCCSSEQMSEDTFWPFFILSTIVKNKNIKLKISSQYPFQDLQEDFLFVCFGFSFFFSYFPLYVLAILEGRVKSSDKI